MLSCLLVFQQTFESATARHNSLAARVTAIKKGYALSGAPLQRSVELSHWLDSSGEEL